ncbi:hypothetical protein ASG32_23205 [Methylobacterium sp. Leaf361]|nr:hypothetical protein ASG32_23205 [Methylobacterium sp. Leaf361]
MQPRAVPNRLTAVPADGREIVRQVDDVPGFVARPMTRDDVERKSRMNAGKRLDTLEVRCFRDVFWTIDERADLTGLLSSLS